MNDTQTTVGDQSARTQSAGDSSLSGLFTYYAYGDSRIHRLDPRTKALWVLVGLIYIFTTDDWRLLLLVAAINVLLTVLAGFELRVLVPVIRALLLFGIVILAFQLLFQSGEVFFALGPIKLHTQGIFITQKVWLRLANLSLLFVQYMMWTHPTDLTLMWERFGIPYRYGMMGSLAVRFFPLFQREVVRIQEAQQVRGQPLKSIWQRIAGLVSVFLPFTLRSLRRTNEIALSMELRGFGYRPTRTYSRDIGMTPLDWSIVVVLLGLIVLRAGVLAGRIP